MKKLMRSQLGFTLAEVLVAVGILTIVSSTIGTATFRALNIQGKVRDDGQAILQLQRGLGQFSSDMRKATATDLVDGAPPVSSLSLTWTDQYQGAGTAHTIAYALVGEDLVRTYDGVSHTLARRVVGVAFSRSSKTFTAQVEVKATPGSTRTLSVKANMRSNV